MVGGGGGEGGGLNSASSLLHSGENLTAAPILPPSPDSKAGLSTEYLTVSTGLCGPVAMTGGRRKDPAESC